MGFTLRAALAVLGSKAEIVVAELVPAVVAWARGPMAEIFGDSLSDPRVNIREADVAQMIERHPLAFDAILLDVDNGPEGLTRKANDALYEVRRIEGGTHGAAARRRAGGLVVRTAIRRSHGPFVRPASTSTKLPSAPPARAAARATSSGSRRRSLRRLRRRPMRVLVDRVDDLRPHRDRRARGPCLRSSGASRRGSRPRCPCRPRVAPADRRCRESPASALSP